MKLAKHLFRHRYDYRAEWMRFTDTLGAPDGAAPLDQRIVKAIADLTVSPAGLLLVPDDDGLAAGAQWNWQLPVEAGSAALAAHLATTGRIVDLDAVRTQKKRAWTDPLGYLIGKLPVTASGTLTTQNGVGRFQLDSAEISGVTVPKSLVQELLSYYSKTTENPAGINMDEPFQLPAAIQEIRIGQGVATIVQ